MHPPVCRRLPLLDGLGIGAAVVDGGPGQGADRLADHVRPAHPGLRRLQHGLLHAVRALHRGIVVLGEHVLLVVLGQAQARHCPGRRPRVVQGVRELVGAGVERGVVGGLVEPGPPDDDRRVVAVADDHLPDIAVGQRLPGVVAEVAPPRSLFPGQQPELVAGVVEGLGLRVVRAAHHVAVELASHDLDVPGLHPGGHGAPGEREELVPVGAEQLDPAAVQVEPVEGEPGLAEPGPHLLLMHPPMVQHAVPPPPCTAPGRRYPTA